MEQVLADSSFMTWWCHQSVTKYDMLSSKDLSNPLSVTIAWCYLMIE
jgi:hypothetical protein